MDSDKKARFLAAYNAALKRRTIQALWDAYVARQREEQPNTTDAQLESGRFIYYAGVRDLFMLMTNELSSEKEEAAMAVVAGLAEELARFGAQAIQNSPPPA